MTDDTEPDILDVLGLNGPTVRPQLPPEDEFLAHMLAGANPRINDLAHWLGHEISHYHYLKSEGVVLHRKTYREANFTAEINLAYYSTLMVKYYLMMYHLPRFDKSLGVEDGVCDLEKTAALLLATEKIQKLVGKVKSVIDSDSGNH